MNNFLYHISFVLLKLSDDSLLSSAEFTGRTNDDLECWNSLISNLCEDAKAHLIAGSTCYIKFELVNFSNNSLICSGEFLGRTSHEIARWKTFITDICKNACQKEF